MTSSKLTSSTGSGEGLFSIPLTEKGTYAISVPFSSSSCNLSVHSPVPGLGRSKPPPVLPSRYLKLVSCISLRASSPWGISEGTIPIHALGGNSGVVNVKLMASSGKNLDFARAISISVTSSVTASSLLSDFGVAGSLDGKTVIFPTPTHLLVPVGNPPEPGTRVHPPLYQSFLPSCSLSSKLHDGAPPEPAL